MTVAFLPIHPLYSGYLKDESGVSGRGEKIAFPESPEEARDCVLEAWEAGKNLTFQGARTGLMGGALPEGGWILNFGRMQALGPVEENRIRAQAGVTLDQLQRKLDPAGLRFPPSPTEGTATLGGIFGTNGGGPDSLLYGSSSAWVEGLLWLTRKGELWRLHRGDYVSQAGEIPLPDGTKRPGQGDLIDHLAGTEGKLGAALELELRLVKTPKEQWSVAFFFTKTETAWAFGERLEIAPPKGLAAAEYFNPGALEILRAHREAPGLKALPEIPEKAQAALLVELTGDCMDSLLSLSDGFEALGGEETMTWAETGLSGVRKLRALQHSLTELLAGPQVHGDFRGGRGFAQALEELAAGARIPAVVYGHWYGGCLRIDPTESVEPEKWEDLLRQAAAWVKARGGSLRGEYGYGRVKRQILGDLIEEGKL